MVTFAKNCHSVILYRGNKVHFVQPTTTNQNEKSSIKYKIRLRVLI